MKAEPERFATRTEVIAGMPLPREAPVEVDAITAILERCLVVARGARGLTFIAFPAPLLAPADLVDAWPGEPLVAWSSAEVAVLGVGVARALRGEGPERWQQVASSARSLEIYGALFADASDRGLATANRSSLALQDRRHVRELGFARPRLFGGGAFAPGSADAGPWVGFGDAWFALPRWTYTRDGHEARLVLAVDEREARDGARWHAARARFREVFAHPPARRGARGALDIARASADSWRTQVVAITSAIDAGACSKIVAARTCTVDLPPVEAREPSHEASLLEMLDENQRECVRLLVRPPGGGSLIAATPERLVRRDGVTVRCDALAGTVRHAGAGDGNPAKGKEAAAQLLASAKDRREHELVVSAIRVALEGLGAEIDAPAEPIVRALRHVLHLHTPIRAELPEPHHVLELVAALHPTPAVGGTPTPYALDWIRDHEPAPRGWYASPVGWFDLDGDGELAVAIRSGVIVGDRAHLWAGAGIVAGSDPDRELAETELKFRAMLGALGVDRTAGGGR